jgi:hypothetical protein
MTPTETAGAWERVLDLENSGRTSQASDLRASLTGDIYLTDFEILARDRREETAHCVAMRAQTDLAVNVVGTGVEVSGICDGLSRPGTTRLISAVRASVEEITGVPVPARSSFDEVDVYTVDFPAARLPELAAALVSRGYRSVTVGMETWAEQMARISNEFDGQYPRGSGSEQARERDLMGRVPSDFPAAA